MEQSCSYDLVIFCVVLLVINQVNEKAIHKNMSDKASLVCN